ncbi:MAG: cyclase family protein [Isosphaerales bacterium]
MKDRPRLLHWLIVLTALAAVAPAPPAGAPGQGLKKLTRADFDTLMTTLSNWGRWGKDDQRGALNLITPEKRKQAAALVREGVSFSLARLAIKEPVDGSPAFNHKMVVLPQRGQDIGSAGDEYSVRYHGFTQTHLDGLCHLAYRGKMYNGFSQDEVTARGAHKLGIETYRSGIFTRCLLMDIPGLYGVPYLEGGRAIYPEDLEAWERKAGVKVESGDAVLIRTGRWARRQQEGPWEIMKGSAGLHALCLPWLKKRDVAVVGSDLALDVLPSGVEGVELPVHWVTVVAMGVPILDNCDLEALSEATNARQRWSFLLTVAPLAVEGGTGSPVNPLATF